MSRDFLVSALLLIFATSKKKIQMEAHQIDWNMNDKTLLSTVNDEEIYEVYGKAGRREYRGTAVYVNGKLLEILDVEPA